MPTLNSVLSLGFADGAFEGLAGPEDLFQLKVLPGLNQQEVPIKKSKMDWPLFRGLRSGQNGHEVSETERVTDKWLRDRMKHLGEVTGFDLPLGPYCFRRGNGEALDSSSTYVVRRTGKTVTDRCSRSHQRFPAQQDPPACELGSVPARLHV